MTAGNIFQRVMFSFGLMVTVLAAAAIYLSNLDLKKRDRYQLV